MRVFPIILNFAKLNFIICDTLIKHLYKIIILFLLLKLLYFHSKINKYILRNLKMTNCMKFTPATF